jgi:hypothetical protein
LTTSVDTAPGPFTGDERSSFVQSAIVPARGDGIAAGDGLEGPDAGVALDDVLVRPADGVALERSAGWLLPPALHAANRAAASTAAAATAGVRDAAVEAPRLDWPVRRLSRLLSLSCMYCSHPWGTAFGDSVAGLRTTVQETRTKHVLASSGGIQRSCVVRA